MNDLTRTARGDKNKGIMYGKNLGCIHKHEGDLDRELICCNTKSISTKLRWLVLPRACDTNGPGVSTIHPRSIFTSSPT